LPTEGEACGVTLWVLGTGDAKAKFKQLVMDRVNKTRNNFMINSFIDAFGLGKKPCAGSMT
jgi:hypothetical protein